MDDIDERVAIEVMGFTIIDDLHVKNEHGEYVFDGTPWQPSKRIDQAWMVVEQMKVDGWTLLLCQQRGGLWVAGFDNVDNPKVSDDADTAPMAICQAALEAKG